MRGPTGNRWRAAADDPRIRRALELVIPDVVDQVLFELLDAVDNEQLPLAWRGSDGEYLPLAQLGLGEMAGWLAGNTWRERFSNQRYFDDFADLHLDPSELVDGEALSPG